MITRRNFLRLSMLATVSSMMAACGSKQEDARLSFLNWQDYIGTDTIRDFEKSTGVKVTYQNYSSNDQLIWMLGQASSQRITVAGYDLCVPSEHAMLALRRIGLIKDFSAGGIHGIENLTPALQKRTSDPTNAFSIPWALGTTGIAWDSRVLGETPDWAIFLDPKLAGKMSLLDESVDGIMIGLLASQLPPTASDAASLQTAVTTLKKMRQQTRLNSSTYLRDLVSGQLSVAMAYSNDFVIASKLNPNLKFVIPQSGGLQWTDCMVIPTKAPRPKRAEEFINFVLQPDISAGISNTANVNTGNAAAYNLIAPEVRNNPAIFPDATAMARAHPLALHDDAALRRVNEAWQQVKNA
ncbi:MAG: spermidine/putrescine ABC transporter substrate-binding protein [Thiothrix sp.]|nr:MAG: spermidine/putrescine ABC transporter substrate-binding protein [Thiothrix sp.]